MNEIICNSCGCLLGVLNQFALNRSFSGDVNIQFNINCLDCLTVVGQITKRTMRMQANQILNAKVYDDVQKQDQV